MLIAPATEDHGHAGTTAVHASNRTAESTAARDRAGPISSTRPVYASSARSMSARRSAVSSMPQAIRTNPPH